MRVVALSDIDHSGVNYTVGEIIEDIEKQDGERLIKLGAAKSVEGEEEAIDSEDDTVNNEEKEEKKIPKKKKATDNKEESEA